MSAKIRADNIRKKYEELDKDKILDKLVDKELEIEKLLRKLRKYENPHTPSSKRGFDKPQAEGLTVGRKPGKLYVHKRTTRPRDTPNVPPVTVTTDVNPSNGNTNIIETGDYIEKVITDYKIEKIVTKYTFPEYKDLNTGELFFAQHPDVPDKGIFGKNVIAFANLLHFENRVTLQGVAEIFTQVYDIPMSAPTVQELCNRAVEKANTTYEEIHTKLQKSPVANADETGSNQNGKSEWLWGFFTPVLAFFVFFPQRGGNIVEKVLKNFNGILGCDGWSTYKVFSEKYGILLQRCWAHLIREVKKNCKDVEGLNEAYVWICNIFEEIQKLRKIKSRKRRQKGYKKLVMEMEQWTQIYSVHDGMKELVNKVKNGKEFWFTCVLHPEVEPTNNSAERGLRKFVVIKKIIGCLRSEQGKRNMQVMLSVFQTWKLQGLNPYKELRAIV
ncbi:MAG: IS66 family transposase [Nanoarchaeota archaeon]